MPITAFQREIFALLRQRRSPESFVFGATVIHADAESPRYSEDIDFSHDEALGVAAFAELDAKILIGAHFHIHWQIQRPAFYRAEVSRDGKSVVLEWVHDSAFRFFPVEPDDDLGYRLHRFDAATNKMLALCGRNEPRDFVDAIYLHQHYLSLGTLVWAAAAKDEGLNPFMIIELAVQFAHYRQCEIDALSLAKPQPMVDLKAIWNEAVCQARSLFNALPAEDIGVAYLSPETRLPVAPDPAVPEFEKLIRHRGSLRGSWPQIAKG